jgi:predicted SnoaL-like aldol condensation-catalyzing enzyme
LGVKTTSLVSAALLAALALFACGHPNDSATKENPMKQPNKTTVATAYEQLFVKKDLSAIDRYFAEPYLQHNPQAPSGLDAFRGFARAVIPNPQFDAQSFRILADGDLVVTHSRYAGLGPTPVVAFDLFRLEGGKIVEHWDGIQAEAPANPSGHTMLDGEAEIRDEEATDKNRALVTDMIESVFIRGEAGKLTTFVDASSYVQHNPAVGDGLNALQAFFTGLHDQGVSFGFSKLHHVLAEGNFVFTIAEGHFGDSAKGFYDLWRVADGKVVEHWDVIQDVPTATASGLSIF